MCEKAGRGWPQICEDDVVDFCIMEAVALRAANEEKEAYDKQKVEQWKGDTSELEAYR